VIAIIATVAKPERVRISQRVRAGLDVARAKGTRLGRPKVVVDAARIANLRAVGRSWQNISEELGIGKGTAQRAFASLPKSYDLRPLVSRARTVSFRIGYVIFAGFWAGKFTNGQAGSAVAASCPIAG
jgi:hypothetical protein